jgi:CoA:oxalate CoA-transferase
LHGVRVVDLTRVLAGPYCTTLLWELGAEVLKIERPGHGDDTRAFPPFVNGESVYFASINRGKRSLALDLQDAGDRVILEDLVGKADVLVENFRPGAMAKLGYDFDTLHAKHPGLLYCSISGFGHTGPYAERAAYDLIVQALGGMISINGSEGSSGVRLGISLGDLAAGAFAAIAINAALYERRESGKGRFIDIAMLDVQTMLLESALVRFFATGESQTPTGSRHPVITPFDVFQTQDAQIAIGCANEDLFRALCAAIGRQDLAASDMFNSLFARYVNNAALKAELEATLKTRPARDWIEALNAAGVPVAPIQTMKEVAADPQLAAREMFVEVDDPEMGRLKMSGNALRISGYPRALTRPPTPNLDEAREDVLAELGRDSDGARMRLKGPPKDPVW